MRVLLFIFPGILVLALFGCAGKPPPAIPSGPGLSAPVSTNAGVIVAPETSRPGQVKLLSASGRFVVLVFPIGHLPLLQERLNVYRQSLKVGEVKVTGPQQDDTIAADIIQGEARPGDTVRSN